MDELKNKIIKLLKNHPRGLTISLVAIESVDKFLEQIKNKLAE